MRLTVLKLLPLLGLLACGTDEETSEQKWAQFKIDYNHGSIPARLLYLKKGFSTNFSKVRVCVQGSDTYAGKSLLLEVKLAYAAWIDASGEGTETTWNRLEFVPQYQCDYDDPNFGSAVAIANYENQDPAQYSSYFNQVVCSPAKSSSPYIRFPAFDCNNFSQTLGLGGPGGAGFWGKTAKSSAPSTATLTPYVEWVSLEEEFKAQIRFANADRNTENRMRMDGFAGPTDASSEELENLLATYRTLKNSASTLSFQKLRAFNKKLAALRYETSENLNYTSTPFARNKYMPQKAAFHTLLHEVGHQFGMAHAHAPADDDHTGSSPTAKKKGGSWVCQDAAMAYNNTYTFLSEDDRLGVSNLQQKLSQLMN